MQFRTRILLIMGLATAVYGAEAAATDLTLDQAVANAIARNPGLQAAAANAQAAAARSQQTKGFRLPKIDLTETFSYSNNPAEVFAMTLNQRRFDFDDFFSSDPNNPDALDTWMTRLEVTQPIYTGGQVGTRVDQAGFVAEAASLDLDHAREKTAFDVATAYANASKAAEHHRLLQRSRDTTAAHVRLAEQYAAQGLIIDAEVLNAKVHLARMEEMLLEAQSNVGMAQSALDLHMGIDQTTRHDLAATPPLPIIDNPMAAWIDQGVAERRDLAARRLEVEAAKLEEKVGKSGYLPEVGVVGRYDLYDDGIFGSNGHSGSIMAVAKINLYRGGSDSAKVDAARKQAHSASLNIVQMEEGIRLEVRSAFVTLQTAEKRIATTDQAVEAAAEALRVREHRFRQGLDKMIDLLDAETSLHEAEVRNLTANYDLSLAAYRLFFTSGTSLINVFGITVPQE